MRKWFVILGSIGMLVLFIIIMGSGVFLKNPITNHDDVIKQLNLIEQSVTAHQWKEANQQIDEQFTIWGKVKNRIQFSVERDFLEEIEGDLATLKGAIVAKDLKKSIEISEKIKVIWRDLGK